GHPERLATKTAVHLLCHCCHVGIRRNDQLGSRTLSRNLNLASLVEVIGQQQCFRDAATDGQQAMALHAESDIAAKIGFQSSGIIVTATEMPICMITDPVFEIEGKLTDWKKAAFQCRNRNAGARMGVERADDICARAENGTMNREASGVDVRR